MTVTITVERDGVEHEVEVEFSERKPSRGKRDSCGGVRGGGAPLEPDEPADLEFVRATLDDIEFELTEGEKERAEQQAWEERQDA